MREFEIGPNEAEQRLDKFLKKLLPGAPLSLIYKLGRTNRAKVDGKKRDDSYRLNEGEIVRIFLSDAEFESFVRSERPNPQGTGATSFVLSANRILFEDADLLAVSKPAGLNVHPGDHKSDEISLIEAVADYYGGKLDTLAFRPSLVHRIDRDTSGIVLVAKTKRGLDGALRALQGGRIEKTYLAVTVGAPVPPEGTIRKKLLRKAESKKSEKVVVDPEWLPAVTHYRTLESAVRGKYCALECRIETGRTHQIRVHLASLGTPILGDASYGNVSENSFARRTFDIRRQLLHAWRLSFRHPVTGRNLALEAPMEEDFQSLLRGS